MGRSSALTGPCEAKLEGCYGKAQHRHHKKMRSQGGSDDPSNVALLCWNCHRRIHDNPAWSYEQGWLVKSWDHSHEEVLGGRTE